MDYIEAFKNLKTNNKWGRKSPHKAVLMLTVIELFEKNILMDNEIRYDETLKSTFLKIWNLVLPNEPLFHPEAYLPFWYLQSDNFWHIVPIRGKEDILSLMRDANIKPSEAKLIDSVKYAELDEDLYFLMTLPSGRSSLKRALLETYTTLTNKQIERLSESKDNAIDFSVTALSEYEKILSKNTTEKRIESTRVDDELVSQFQCLNEDVQLALNIVYFSFLKKHRNEREMFKEVCPTVYDLLDKIVNHPIKQGEIAPSFAFVYDNFLSDLKVALLSEDGSVELVDKIGEAIEILRGNHSKEYEESLSISPVRYTEEDEPIEIVDSSFDELKVEHVYLDERGKVIETTTEIAPEQDNTKECRRGKTWTEDEENLIKQYYQQGKDFITIASLLGRTEVAIKARLAKLGLIDYTYGQEKTSHSQANSSSQEKTDESDYNIENYLSRCTIRNKFGESVFSSDGYLKYICGKLYCLNFKKECFTLKNIYFDGNVWMKGEKKIVAYPQSSLYKVLENESDFLRDIEDIIDSPIFKRCKLKVKGFWYKYNGALDINTSGNNMYTNNYSQQEDVSSTIVSSPKDEEKTKAILRAMSFFREPATPKNIARMVSRSAWGGYVYEESVDSLLKRMPEIEYVKWGKYKLKEKQ